MKKLILTIFIFCMFVGMAQAASNITFAWDASVGAATYKVYQSTISGTYNKTTGNVCNGAALTCTVSNIPDGRYYWVATALDASGNESVYSNELTALFDTTAPSAPGAFKITLTVNVTVSP
jgi:hypothetical protein